MIGVGFILKFKKYEFSIIKIDTKNNDLIVNSYLTYKEAEDDNNLSRRELINYLAMGYLLKDRYKFEYQLEDDFPDTTLEKKVKELEEQVEYYKKIMEIQNGNE